MAGESAEGGEGEMGLRSGQLAGSWLSAVFEHTQCIARESDNDGRARTELQQMAATYGEEGTVHVLHALLLLCSPEDLRSSSSNYRALIEAVSRAGGGISGPAAAQALSLCAASQPENPLPKLSDVLHVLQLSLSNELLLAMSLYTDPGSDDLKAQSAALLKERVVDICQSGALRAASFSWNMIQRLLLFLRANTGEFIKQFQSVSASLVANYTPKDLPLNVRSLVLPEESGSMSVRGMLQEGFEGTELQEHLDNFVKHAKVIEEIGYSCTASPDSFATVLDMLPPPDEASVAEMISMMARTYSGLDGGGATLLALNTALGEARTPEPGHRTTWSVDIAIDVLLPRIQHVSFPAAMMHLDHPEFFIPDQTSFTLLMQMFNRATSERFPINAICGRPWANTEGQLSFLSHAVNASAEVFSFEHSPNKQAPLDGLSSNKQATGTANQCWLSLDLISTLFDLAELGHYAKVRTTFEQPRKHCPEVLFLGIAQASSRWTELQSELFNAMVPSFMSNHPNSTIVMHRLWQTKRELALQGMVDVYARDRSSITRVLDICQDVKELGTVLQSTPYTFALDLAALAARREYLNIEKWLGEQISMRGRPFVSACCEFLKGLAEEARAEKKPAVSVSEETYALFVKVLQQRASEDLPQPEADDAKQTCDELLDSNQRLQRLLAESQTFGPQTFSRDVEDDANSHFQQLYMGKCDAEELSKTLSRYRSSGGPHEKQVLACIIRNLLDEYRFFPRYPERELRLTASLFGEIIHYGLLEPLTLGLALRLILDSLRKDPSNHMYIFGSEALEGFKTRALEWRQFCEQLLHSPHLRTTHPEFVRTIERAHLANGHAPQNSAVTDGAVQSSQSHADAAAEAANAMFSHQSSSLLQADASTRGDAGGRSIEAKMASMSLHGNVNGEQMTTSSSTEAGAPSFGGDDQRQQQQRSQSNIYVPNTNSVTGSIVRFGGSMTPETMDNCPENQHIVKPDPSVEEPVAFVFNNISSSNLEQKAQDLENVLGEEHYEWFANYLVVKRAAMESNLQSLYMNLIDRLGNARLKRLLLQATYRNVKVVVYDEKCKHSTGERSILKNLGMWLGEQTIAKNRPVLQKDLDIKVLLIEAFKSGRLIAVLPFVTRVLEPAKNSKVFAPPNPWIMAILSLLVEIYSIPDLKLNNKFEIERLFKQLDTKLEDITPSNVLEGLSRQTENNADFAKEKAAAPSENKLRAQPAAQSAGLEGVGQQETSNESAFSLHGRQGQPVAAAAFQHHQQEASTSDAAKHPSPYSHTQNQYSQPPQLMSQPPSFASVPAAAVQPSDYKPPNIPPSVPYSNLITLNQQMAALAEKIKLRQAVEQAIGSAVNDAYPPILERSVKIACNTTQFLTLKDFALEPDENRLKKAAIHMACNLAGGLALVTVRESMKQHLSHKLSAVLSQFGYDQYISQPQLQQLADDNADLCCGMVEQAAVSRARTETEDMLHNAFEGRKQHREKTPSKPFYDTAQLPPNALGKIPESLRPQTSHMNPHQEEIYEDFNLWPQLMKGTKGETQGQSTLSQHQHQQHSDRPSGGVFESGGTQGGTRTPPSGQSEVQHVLDVFNVCIQRIESAAMRDPQSTIDSVNPDHEARMAVAELSDALQQCTKPEDAGLSVSKRAFTRACSYANVPMCVTALVATIAAAASVSSVLAQQIPREVTSWLIQAEDQHKFKRGLLEPLVRRKLVVLSDFDRHLAQDLMNVRSAESGEYAYWLVNKCVTERIANPAELPNVLETLRSVAHQSGQSDLMRLVEQAMAMAQEKQQGRAPAPQQPQPMHPQQPQQVHQPQQQSMAQVEVDTGAATASAQPQQVPPGRRSVPQTPHAVQEQVAQLFDEWARLTDKAAGDTLYVSFFAKLQNAGVLLPEDNQEQFFRIMTEIAVAHCQQTDWRVQQGSVNAMPPPALNFVAVDAYIRLLMTLVRTLPEAANSSQSTSFTACLGILSRGINAITSTLLRHADERPYSFNPRPYLRMLCGLLMELNAPDTKIDLSRPEVLALLANAFLTMQPQRVPPFAVAWIELASDRSFMPRLLKDHKRRGWPLMNKLLVCVLKFMEPYLRKTKLTEALRMLYKGVLRVMLVILHDFPEFFVDHHMSFCDVLPATCIQLRNVVLSAYPTGMKLPDPFMPDLKVDLLPSMRESPPLSADADAEIRKRPIRQLVDSYLVRKEPPTIVEQMLQSVQLSQQEAISSGTIYNVPLVNALVLYIGVHAINLCEQRNQQPVPMSGSAETELFVLLIDGLNEEGRYHVLNAITNQLRYPNNHTHFFSCLLLFIFAEVPDEGLKEQITRVLLERLLANRPHPWGLLITFIELLKNPKYKFWNHSFAHLDQNIERLFRRVATSSIPPAPAADGVGAAPLPSGGA